MVLTTYARCLNKQLVSMNEKYDEFFYDGNEQQKSMNETINNELLLKLMSEQLKKPEFLEMALKAMRSTNNAVHAKGAV